MFGYVIYYPYLCITESVITPTGGASKVGESGLHSALYLYISPILYEYHNHHKGLFFLFNIIIK